MSTSFDVTYTSKAASRPADAGTSTALPPKSPAAIASAEGLREWRRERHAAFCAKHEEDVVHSVPLEARLLFLLEEGRRHELHRAKDSPARQRVIRQAYANLVQDVRARCALIRSNGQSDTAHKHNVGSEAISCFASMLPWSDSVVAAETVRVPEATEQQQRQQQPLSVVVGGGGHAPPLRRFGGSSSSSTSSSMPTVRVGVASAAAAASSALRVGNSGGAAMAAVSSVNPKVPGIPPPMTFRKRAHPQGAAAAAAAAGAPTTTTKTVFRIPDRLATDTTKLVAAANSRVARLPRPPYRAAVNRHHNHQAVTA